MRSWRSVVHGLVLGLVLGLTALEATEFLVESDRLTLGSTDLTRQSTATRTLRIMSWNVKAGSLFPATMPNPEGEEAGARVGRFGRVLRALRPDVLCLQEIWPLRENTAILELLNRELPLSKGQDWHVHRAVDVVIASRYPLKQKRGDRVIHFPLPEMPEFHYGQALCLVDLPEEDFDTDLFLITAHFRSRSGEANIRMRERHAESILERLEDLRSAGGDIDVPVRTPIVIAGDFNVYHGNVGDDLNHLRLLISGNTHDDSRGESSPPGPDWDGSELIDLSPSINGQGKAFYTWRNDTLPYPPGALDRILYTDSVLGVEAAFVLDAESLSSDLRKRFGILRSDGAFAGRQGEYDHLPMIVDFSFAEPTSENR